MRTLLSIAIFSLALAVPVAAQQLPTTVQPSHYDLAFTVDLQQARFRGTETIDVDVAQPTTRVVLNAIELDLRAVTIGEGAAAQKAAVTFDEPAQTATLTVARPLPRGRTVIHIAFTGTLNDQLRGFYLSKADGRNYAVTQFESSDARRAFPCFDEPSFKATFALTVTLDRGDTAISNGRVLADTPGPAPTQHTMRFSTSPRMSSYLVAIAVGDFQCVEGAADGIPIRICATPDKKRLTRIALESAEQILKFYDTYFALKYPFGKLDVVAVPDFAAGAMENTASIFYRETDLLADEKSASLGTRKNIASVLAHEMAHQWFGDLVTMAWWDDIWLNEGFATWMANKPLQAAHPDWQIPVDEADENQTALGLDSLAATRPIHASVETPAEIDAAFDSIAYEKGAAVLRMIESYVGAETFRKGINAYLQAHAYGNATSEDFWKAIASTSGKPVERILPTFVNQPGVPLVEVSLACAGNRTLVTLTQQRFRLQAPAAAGPSAGRWQVPVCLRAPGQRSASCDVLTGASQTVTMATASCAPWVLANAGARGYYRTAYAPEMLSAMAPHVESDLSPAERLTLADDEWALVRSGRHSAAAYLTLASGFGGEHTSGVLEEVTSRLAFIREYLTDSASRPRLEAFTRSLLRPLFQELGMTPSPTDTDERRALRAVVVQALGTTGEAPDVVAQSRAAAGRALAGGSALDPTFAGAVIRTAAAHGDASLFDALAAAADRTESPEDQYRYLYALGDFAQPDLIQKGLERALSPRMRSQDTALYLSRFLANPAARDQAWSFVREHWDALAPTLTIFGNDTRLVSALGSFCDAGARDGIRSFFAAHPLPGAARALRQTLEEIDNCIALRERQTTVVAEWLSSR